MRLLIALCCCSLVSSAFGQETGPARAVAPVVDWSAGLPGEPEARAPVVDMSGGFGQQEQENIAPVVGMASWLQNGLQQTAPGEPAATPQTTPAPRQPIPRQPAQQQPTPRQPAQQPMPRPAPEPSALDDLDLDANQNFNFDDSENSQFTSANFESSIASNSNFRGASPQMIGDFGGGSTIFRMGDSFSLNFTPSGELSVPVPFAGGSRRIKFAENNQVQPLNRVYGTYNYFHNAFVAGGLASPVQTDDLNQGAFGIEKTFLNDNFSVDVRMPFTGGINHSSFNLGPLDNLGQQTVTASRLNVRTSGTGNLSTAIKAYLLGVGQTSISAGLGVSIPTGSGVTIQAATETFVGSGDFTVLADTIRIGNHAVHLMPFVGASRTIGKSFWLQSFIQVDAPTNGNEVYANGLFRGRIREQTLLYTDVSLGKWLYRNPCNSARCGGKGVTGIASLLELHYTTSLNDADLVDTTTFNLPSALGFYGPGAENRFDVLNLTVGLQTEISELWRVNVAGVFPLRERHFNSSGSLREDRFFDGEFSLQINRFF